MILNKILIDKQIITKWLKAGYIDKIRFFLTKEGTPKSGIISPILSNMVLDGLETAIYSGVGTRVRTDGCKRNKFKVDFVRYTYDFIITGSSE